MSEEREDIVREIADLVEQLSKARERLTAFDLARAGVKVGDIVRSTSNYSRMKDVEFRVTRVSPFRNEAWVHGCRKNKNGKWSKRSEHLFGDWVLVGSGDAA